MSLFQACRGSSASLGAFVLIVALGRVATAQPVSGFEQEAARAGGPAAQSGPDLIDRYLETIEAEESRNGPFSPALTEQLEALGFALQERGEHNLAVEALDRALQTTRVNDGLYTLEQLPLLRQLATSERARGNEAGAAELQQRMLRLAYQQPDDPRSTIVFREAAEADMAVYARYREFGPPPQLTFGAGGAGGIFGPPPAAAGNPTTRALRRAQRHYSAAIRGILRRAGPADPSLPELERALVRSYFVESSDRKGRPRNRERAYRLGRESYRRLVVYRTLGAGSGASATVEFARGLIELADWDLVFSRNGKALEGYAQAQSMLAEAGMSPQAIAAIFAPQTPVLLPAFLPNPLAVTDPDGAADHIDVAFELGRFGTTHRIEILDAPGAAADRSTKDAFRFLAMNRFRPRVVDGESGRTAPYYLHYLVDD